MPLRLCLLCSSLTIDKHEIKLQVMLHNLLSTPLQQTSMKRPCQKQLFLIYVVGLFSSDNELIKFSRSSEAKLKLLFHFRQTRSRSILIAVQSVAESFGVSEFSIF